MVAFGFAIEELEHEPPFLALGVLTLPILWAPLASGGKAGRVRYTFSLPTTFAEGMREVTVSSGAMLLLHPSHVGQENLNGTSRISVQT